jgi:hypothetical protein
MSRHLAYNAADRLEPFLLNWEVVIMFLRPASLVLIGLLGVACAGCAPGLTAIPTGQWTGSGTYVDYQADRKEVGKAEARAMSAVYPTSLGIKEGDLYGRRALFVDVRSKRGKLMTIEGQESHVAFTLVKVETLADGSSLYALVEFEFNPSAEERVSKKDFDDRIQVASAVCFRRERGLVLQVNYVMPTTNEPVCFWDTFIFEGGTVRKVGRVVQVRGKEPTENVAAVDWVEELQRVR